MSKKTREKIIFFIALVVSVILRALILYLNIRLLKELLWSLLMVFGVLIWFLGTMLVQL